MPKYRGRVDCYINPTSDGSSGGTRSRGSSEVFTNIVQHLSSSGPDLGIEMLAANYGTNGSGWNFWDQANTIGHRAWACFRFHSASLGKFDMLVFVTTGSSVPHGTVNIGNSNFSYANGSGQTGTHFNIGLSFASHPSGSNVTQSDGPWNGTYSLTSASMGNPIWKLNSQGKGAFFPRSNNFYGSFSGSRNNIFGIAPGPGTAGGNPVPPWRQHVIISEDSFSIFLDDPATTNGFRPFHFGSFTPLSGTRHESPYFTYHVGRQDSGTAIRNFYPTPSGGTSDWGITRSDVESSAYINEGIGAVSYPDLLYGTRAVSYQTFHSDSNVGYNNYINSGSWELLPTFITMNERSFTMLLGLANHIKFVYGMTHGTLSNSSSSIAIGRGTASTTEIKYVFPWSGEPMLSGTVRTGRTFTYNT